MPRAEVMGFEYDDTEAQQPTDKSETTSEEVTVTTEETSEQVEETPVQSEAEIRARASGWVSKEEFVSSGKDASDWVDAHQFNVKGELMDAISTARRENRNLSEKVNKQGKAIKDQAELYRKMMQAQKEDTLESMRRAKAQAITEGDAEAIASYETAIDKLKDIEIEDSTEEEDTTTSDETVQFNEEDLKVMAQWASSPENSWYKTDVITAKVFNAAGDIILQANPDIGINELLAEAKKMTVKELPHKFKSERKPPATVEGTSSQKSTHQKWKLSDLNDEQKEIGRNMADAGGITLDEYIQELGKMGELD